MKATIALTRHYFLLAGRINSVILLCMSPLTRSLKNSIYQNREKVLQAHYVSHLKPLFQLSKASSKTNTSRLASAFLCGLFLTSGAVADPITLTQSDLLNAGPFGWIAPRFAVPPIDQTRPIVDPTDTSPEASLLRRLYVQGKTAGFSGVVYENRDRNHSNLSRDLFPQLAFLEFEKELQKTSIDYGLAGNLTLPAIVFGNSSTAHTSGANARSQPRFAMTTAGGPARAFQTYTNNHIYFYPEHRDHDAADLFPANWPYMIVSQGSSGSDLPFLRAVGFTLAALAPDTREMLEAKKLIAPTVQMILRRSLSTVTSRDSYLTGLAHPTVFTAETLSPARMVSLASSLRPSDIPPMVRLEVESEDFSDAADLANLSERLFDTPSAIARVWRSNGYTHDITLTAANTVNPTDRPISYRWVVLRGDPEHIRITPLDSKQTRARIGIDWHEARQITPTLSRKTNRVDIGVFAWNGVHYSAPAFLSITFPNHQQRIYDKNPVTGKMHLNEINYSAGTDFDPLIFWSAPWQDHFEYGTNDRVTSWTRRLDGQEVVLRDAAHTTDGALLSYSIKKQDGRPVLSMDISTQD